MNGDLQSIQVFLDKEIVQDLNHFLCREDHLEETDALALFALVKQAAAYAGLGELNLAKEGLAGFHGKEIGDGQALKFLEQRNEFAVLKGDKAFLDIKQTWN